MDRSPHQFGGGFMVIRRDEGGCEIADITHSPLLTRRPISAAD